MPPHGNRRLTLVCLAAAGFLDLPRAPAQELRGTARRRDEVAGGKDILASERANASSIEYNTSATEVGELKGNLTSLWGIPLWGSCQEYGCHSAFHAGQWCGCWPGCRTLGICCTDYEEICHDPAPVASCASYGCGVVYLPWQACSCTPLCHTFGTCCSDYKTQCEQPQRPEASCAAYGCSGGYKPDYDCQCNEKCRLFGNCCHDYGSQCASHPSHPGGSPSPPAQAPAPAPVPAPLPPTSPSDGELHTFYIYRAQSSASYPPKNINAANLIGVMWYLQHEVVTQNPPKFGISRILRYKVQTKAPAALLKQGMHFGVRYAYDSQKCTGPGDCSTMYRKYGYFVGCNNFASMYPYPTKETQYAGGVWYSFPGAGACDGPPTGAADCTYSYSWPPQEVTIEELQGSTGRAFWDKPHDSSANAAKVRAAADLFRMKYPDAEDLPAPPCDFAFSGFWQE